MIAALESEDLEYAMMDSLAAMADKDGIYMEQIKNSQ